MSNAADFDFWLGQWDCAWEGGGGVNTISRILDGNVIEERFDSSASPTSAMIGLSVSVFNEQTRRWHQTWVDNQGGYLDFVGDFTDGKMILSREAMREGQPVQQRMVWFDITPAAFEWHWDRSLDGSSTWETLWHISYRRKA
jgi:hypothetical protein